jgi:hypothetical protein
MGGAVGAGCQKVTALAIRQGHRGWVVALRAMVLQLHPWRDRGP